MRVSFERWRWVISIEGVASSFVQVEPVQAGDRFPQAAGPRERVCTITPSSPSIIEGNSQCEMAN